MAGLKKKKKEPSSSPNIVLVVFLIFFILATITLGALFYYGLDEKGEARRKQVAAVKDSEQKARDALYYRTLYYNFRAAALGDQLNADDEEKVAKEEMIASIEELMKPDFGKFSNGPKDKETTLKLVGKLRDRLGVAANNVEYKSSLEEKLKVAEDEAARLRKDHADEVAKNRRFETISRAYSTKQDAFQTDIAKQIKNENAAILNAAKAQTDAFKELSKAHAKLKEDLEGKNQDLLKATEDNEKEVKKLTRKINLLDAALKENAGAGGGALNANRPVGDAFPLVLDLTPGKPLWDAPVGKIVRIDLEHRQVAINLGSAHGVVPELTFNLFGAGPTGRAEKQMKGTIEVIKVLDATTSLCRITSLYDADAREIPLNVGLQARVLRESEAPIREGDLLFNLFWGTRVAIAGYVSMTGEPSDNPAEQMRQMEDFMYLLKRNGMQVDAYVDLRDGQMRGNITPKTRYLIRGDDLKVAAEKPAAEDKEKDKDKEPKANEAQPNAERNETINKSSKALRTEAIDRGLLLISAENFATVIGYRKARNGNSVEASGFRPGLPYAGTERIGAGAAAPVPDPRPKEPEKKGEEKKDMEKKDAN